MIDGASLASLALMREDSSRIDHTTEMIRTSFSILVFCTPNFNSQHGKQLRLHGSWLLRRQDECRIEK